MVALPPSYSKVTHSATYAGIRPTQPGLSTAGKVMLITGTSGGIGRAAASSFATSGPRALVLPGRRAAALAETAALVRASHAEVAVQTHEAELRDAPAVGDAMSKVPRRVRRHRPDPTTFLDGYKTTAVGTLVAAQAVVLANKTVSADRDRPMAAVTENPQVRLHNVHPGFLKPAMSAKLSETTKLPHAYDDTEFPRNKIVFASWDIDELRSRRAEIVGSRPGTGRARFPGFSVLQPPADDATSGLRLDFVLAWGQRRGLRPAVVERLGFVCARAEVRAAPLQALAVYMWPDSEQTWGTRRFPRGTHLAPTRALCRQPSNNPASATVGQSMSPPG
ncbi:hypothetical protein VUR80DRAFT_7449 [Thermomyces stellatus]